VHYRVNTWHPCIHKSYMWRICREYEEGSMGKIFFNIQMVPHACRIESKALHALEICETCHIWLGDLVNYVHYVIWWKLWYVELWTCICCLVMLLYLRNNVDAIIHFWNPWLQFIWLCLLCGILSNPQWSFGWPPTYLYKWEDGLHDCVLLC